LRTAQHGDVHRPVDPRNIQCALQAVDAIYRERIDGNDSVVSTQSAERSRARLHDLHHMHAARRRQVEITLHAPRDGRRRAGHADVRTPHATMREELHDDPLGGVDGGRERDRLRTGNDRGIHTDHLTRRVDQRAARVAGIQRGVGLDDIVDHAPGVGPQRPSERRDHPGRDRLREAERVPYGDGDLPDTQLAGFTQFDVRQRVGRADAQHREVAVRIVADEIGVEFRAVRERHADMRRAMHNVAIRQQITVGREDETRTGAAACAAAVFVARQTPFDGNKGDRLLHPFERADDGLGISVQKGVVAEWACEGGFGGAA